MCIKKKRIEETNFPRREAIMQKKQKKILK